MNNGEIWLPPPDLTVSEWADEYRFLSGESSAEPGKWLTDRAPYQREMMDSVKQSERVVIMTAAQVGKTELLLNTIGYFVHYDPCPIMILQPTLQMGEDFSKNKLEPMIRDTPSLSCLIDQKSRNRNNNILYKKFDNLAVLTITGANSPASLASRSIRVLLCDETDRYPPSAGEEGDPLSLAMKRTQNFWNRRIVWVSTPTLKSISRIEKAYALSDKSEWCVPCPRCGEYQPYLWENLLYEDKTVPVMKCTHCGQEFSEYEWKSGRGKWLAGAESAIRGFHLNAFASPWVRWQDIVSQYQEAKSGGEETMKTWVNTVLGEPYEMTEGTLDAAVISGRAEKYDARIPEGVQYLTCGVDTQDNRLELEVVGWGAGYESWGIEYRILYGVPGSVEVWQDLDEYLSQTWPKADGTELGISCVCIDAGGHFTDSVLRFTKTRARRRIYAVFGRGTFGHPCISGPSRNNRQRVPVFMLGVNTLKGMLFSRLQAEKGESGYCHFPEDKLCGYDEMYFSGLLSERMTLKRKNGRDVIVWEKRNAHVRNEPLDCRVYAGGAIEILQPKFEKPAVRKSSAKPAPEKVYKPRRLLGFRRGLSM